MVMDALLINQELYRHGKTLVITGERAEESKARANYNVFEPHRADLRDGKKYKRHIDHWRPVHSWDEHRVWEIMERYRINPAWSYHLGWGRLSCMVCIFGSDEQFASAMVMDPERVSKMAAYEKEFNCSIHRTKYLAERLQSAKPYIDMDPVIIGKALSVKYEDPLFVGNWKLPSGAYGDSSGPS